MGFPAVGVLLSKSMLWNTLFCAIWIAWMIMCVMGENERCTSATIGVFFVNLFSVLYLEIAPGGRLWAYMLSFYVTCTLPVIYAEKRKYEGLIARSR